MALNTHILNTCTSDYKKKEGTTNTVYGCNL